MLPRSLGASTDHSRNAACAALTARWMSGPAPFATFATTEPSAGFFTSKVAPPSACTHSPLMYIRSMSAIEILRCWRIGATSPREPTPVRHRALDAPRQYRWGPRNGPHAPHARPRPGVAVARLGFAVAFWGPRKGPHAPHARPRPGVAVAAPRFRVGLLGAPKWPPCPPRSAAPRRSRGAPRFRLGVREVGDEPAGGAQELSVAVARADELDAQG